jgi:voltage-gated sodium channel
VLARACRRIADSKIFQNFIIAIIGVASILVGLETFQEITEEHLALFTILDGLLLTIFTVEVAIRLIANGRRPWEFFKNPWNVFDVLTVAIFYLPFIGSEVAILRLARVIRMLRLVRAVPGLRLLVVALIHSLPSIGYIGVLLLGQIYIFAILGCVLFGGSDPERFRNVAIAMQTLVQVVTFDDWATIMRAQENQLISTIYFVIFILSGTMIILNLFIGVVMDGFTQARQQFAAETQSIAAAVTEEASELETELAQIHERLTELTQDMQRLMAASQRTRANGETIGQPGKRP